MNLSEADALAAVAAVARPHDPGALVFVGAREYPQAQQRSVVTIVVQTYVNNHAMVRELTMWCTENDGYWLTKSQVVQMGEVPVDLIEIETVVYYKE